MNHTRAEAALLRAQGQTDDELLIDLGRSLKLEEGLEAFATVEELRQAGTQWLAQRQTEFAAALCPNSIVQSICRSGEKGDRELFVAVFDTLAAVFVTKLPVPMGTLVALLIRRGLKLLCGSDWPPDKQQP